MHQKTPRYHIFLSYRREDGKDIARLIKESLVRKGYRVFLDLDELQDGVFDSRILDAINSAPIYMLVMTKQCFNRCANPQDWVRQEIEYAIAKGKTIIPLNIDSEFERYPTDMPVHLQHELSVYQYSAIDTKQLYQESINKLEVERIQPVLAAMRPNWKLWILFIIFLLGILLFGGYYYFNNYRPIHLIELGDARLQKDSTTRSDTIQAIDYYQKAIAAGNIRGYGKIGTIYYKSLILDDRGRYANNDTAIMYFQKGAYAGDGYAQVRLALCLRSGLVAGAFTHNTDSALYWAETAYNNKYYEAAATLALMYRYGDGVEKDIKRAEKLYREALKNGDIYDDVKDEHFTATTLGNILTKKKNENYDYVEGCKYLLEAYEHGDVMAQWGLHMNKYLVFAPHIDSVTDSDVRITAVMHDRKDTLQIHCEYYNSSYMINGWMRINSNAYVENAFTQERYPISNLQGCKFSPDTTSVKWLDTHKFVLLFANVPDTITKINFCESDTSDWKFYGIDLSAKKHIEGFQWDTTIWKNPPY